MIMTVLVVVGGVIVFCLGHVIYADLKRRIIPCRDCYGIAVCGSVLQFMLGGTSALLAGFGFGVLALCFCLGIQILGRRMYHCSDVVGGGDMRLIVALSLATGSWAPWGAFGAALVAMVWAVIGIATSRLSMKDTFPMAPCLACWPAVSLGISLL